MLFEDEEKVVEEVEEETESEEEIAEKEHELEAGIVAGLEDVDTVHLVKESFLPPTSRC